ncbi:hypothetical protein STEG23_037567, partial [Scotinomys teguina]
VGEEAIHLYSGQVEAETTEMTRPYVKKLSFTLLDSITDKDPVVQEQVCSALCSLGESQPGETLCACEEYLRQHDKLAHPYRTKVLRAMETVLSSHIHELDKDTAGIVILLASSEMTRTKELDCDWQQAASSVLVAVGKRFINQVMEEVLSRFQPGILPHPSVLHTLASLSVSNAFGMVPFLPSILSTMLPMLGMAKQDALRVVFCCALQHFSESTLEYLANLDQAPDPTVRKDTFAADIFGAYDILFHHWLQSRDAKLRLAVVAALGPMSHLLPNEKLEEQLPKLLPVVLGLYKKHAETFQISKSLGQILEAAVSVGSRTLEVQLDALLVALHAQVKRAVVQVISAMAHHGYLEQPGGEVMVDYIVQQCALPPEEPEKPGPNGEEPGADSVRAVSIRTLYLVSTTVDRMNSFLQDTLAVVSDNTWICQLSQEMCKQLPSYNGTPQEKNFLYKCIGTTLGAASSKEVVRKHLRELLETARYQEEAEQEGLACCFGICAITHLEDTLAQLEEFVRSDVFRKSIGIFSIFKDRSEHEVERMKSFLILCYGHVAAQAPRELVLAKVESDILRSMFQCFNTKVLGIKVETKDPALKLSLVQSLCMVCQAMCSSAQASSFQFSRKAELVSQMKEFIRAEPPDCLRTPIRKKAMLACTYLINLEPVLEEQAQADLIHSCLHSVMALPPEPKGEDGTCQEPLYLDTLCALEDLLTSLLQRNMTPQGLQIMVEHLSLWIKSPRGHERARALGLGACLLRFFLEHLHVSTLVPFHNLGLLVGLFAPRCADTWTTTRQEAVGCIHSLLYLQLGYEGFSRDHRDEAAERLLTLKDGLVYPDPTILFHTCHSIAQVIAKRLPSDQLISLLLTMFESLGDPDKNCSRASTVMINCLLKERGNVLLEKVPEIVSVLRAKLRDTQEEHILPAAQHSVYLLASQHCEAVVSSLLGSPLPFDSHTCALWRALAVEPSLTTQVLGLLLDKMSRDVPFKESRAFLLGSTADRVATLLPLAATCALYEVLSAPSSGTVVLELYPQLFVALLLRVSCTVGVQLPRNLQGKERRSTSPAKPARNLDPCSSAVDALQAFLLRSGNQDVLRCVELEGGWELLRTSAGHEDGVAQLASSMAKHAGPRLPLVMKALTCTQGSVYEIQRVTSTAFLAELLSSNVVNDLMLLEPLLDNLTARLKDSSASVRRLVLRGLANIASGSPDKVRAHGPQLMTAMVSGLDDGDEPHSLVALEAMVGLARLLDLVEPWDLRLVLLHTTIRIRPFFDSEKVEFRTASIRLFGHLNKACHGDCEDVFLEQVVGGLVPLLLHLRDPQASVASACKFALCMCVPHLECAELAAAFHKYLQEGRSVHFGEFLNSTCKHLMHHFPDLLGRLVSTNLFYFKSSWDDVRAAAPMFTGFLVLHAEPEQKPQVDLEQLIAALQLLLKDPVPGVREKAAETLGRLVKFA